MTIESEETFMTIDRDKIKQIRIMGPRCYWDHYCLKGSARATPISLRLEWPAKRDKMIRIVQGYVTVFIDFKQKL
jgi:hypothetical protein